MQKKGLFRQVALNRLSSPEELDSLLQVTSGKGWLALAGIALLLLTLIVWSVLGKLPTKLMGQQCILVKNGGVIVLTTSASGRLSDLAVEPGDMVTRGQIIGRLEQYDLLQKIKSSEARLKEVEAQHAQAVVMAEQGLSLRDATMAQQTQNLQRQLASANQRGQLLQERIDSQTSLFEQGLITKQTLIASQLELAAVRLEAETIKGQFKQQDVVRLEGKKQSDNEVVQTQNQLDDVKRTLVLMRRDAKNFTSIISPYSGRVLEVKAAEGQLVERGTQLISVEPSGVDMNEIEAYIYLPAAEGKKVSAGMKVEISPSTAKREEFGFLPAFISSVADYPSTDQGLMRVFANEKLVQQLTGTLAPIQILASLKPSSVNPSHYEWSTRSGPPFSIQSGTACSAAITLSEQRPITLVLPILKKALGLD
ncbi:NHLP bacteriocin system secretion protein [Iodobacter sp. CM08]|uniref:NHLP bacteriocin system secretion protein n=1 Tax=Iodobacter sp. CM08 TaxID=3085902 RepID=UPI002981E34B|nr:NHLP bacteriocin system secretion protein [Iodobacter sp. CM08]MDW5416184.1 NHLP bacteriocin system secretion protein [Iodobacter sp. CM08]